jgi:hypothetical protein
MFRSAIFVALVAAAGMHAQPAAWQSDALRAPDVRQATNAIYLPPIVPPAWQYLKQPSVRAELNLTGAQKARFDLLIHLGKTTGILELCSLGLVPTGAIGQALPQARDNFLANTLNKDQRLRLRQIEFQLKEREFGAHAAFAMAARDLGLRPDQIEDVSSLKSLRVEEIAKLVTSGERFEKVKPKVEAANGDTYERMTEMLTRTQRERLKELRGKAFGGKVEFVESATKEAARRREPAYPAELFGVFDFEIRFLDSLAVRQECGIREDQVESIRRAIAAWEELRRPLPIDRLGELHETTANSLSELLTPKQRKRFDELMTRRRLGYGGREAACGYPPTATALKLSPVQITKLKGGESAGEVLTHDQGNLLETLLGSPFQLSSNVVDPVNARFRKPGLGGTIHDPEKPIIAQPTEFARKFLVISDRLKLSEEQIKKLRELAEDEPKFFELIQRELSYADTPPVVGSGRGFTPAAAVADQYREAVEEQCLKVLDDQQKSIARQILGLRPRR